MKLSILILSIHKRKEFLDRIISELNYQIQNNKLENQVEVLTEIDNGELSIGIKRNSLKNKAIGEYICYIDDDDLVPEYYLKEIFAVINKGYDLINFFVEQKVDGVFKKIICPNTSIDYLEVKDIFFWCNMLHLCPHKKQLAQSISFPNINSWEDLAYSKELKKICKNNFRIEKTMYYYLFDSNK